MNFYFNKILFRNFEVVVKYRKSSNERPEYAIRKILDIRFLENNNSNKKKMNEFKIFSYICE